MKRVHDTFESTTGKNRNSFATLDEYRKRLTDEINKGPGRNISRYFILKTINPAITQLSAPKCISMRSHNLNALYSSPTFSKRSTRAS
jgi:hypothetical protein